MTEFEPDLIKIAERLDNHRPVPRASFRGDLGRRLADESGRHRPRPERLRLMINAYAGSGAALLAVAAAGLAGLGPFGA